MSIFRNHRFYIAALIVVLYGILYVLLGHFTIQMGQPKTEEVASPIGIEGQ